MSKFYRRLISTFTLVALVTYQINPAIGANPSTDTSHQQQLQLLQLQQQQQRPASKYNQISLNPHYKTPNHYKRIPAIEVFGNKFFYSNNGSQFFIRGIAYQPDYNMYRLPEGWDHISKSYIDPLAFPDICQRDIKNLRELNINTVRVYAIDPKLDHDYCMNLFAENDIYVLADLSEPHNSIVREMPSWDVDLYERYKDVITTMQKYDNLLGFFAGNEVITDYTNLLSSPFVKASVRDSKQFIKTAGYRKIPIGYSTNDDAFTRSLLKDYFVCGDDDDAKVDFYGINNYEWCGHSTFGISGYSERKADFKDYPVPVFFSEFGCNTFRPRPFTEVDALFSPLMTEVFSGGIMYMYFEEPNDYGIVQVEDLTNITSAISVLDEFKFLKYQYGKANPLGINKKDYQLSYKASKIDCPVPDSNSLRVSNVLPKTPDLFRCGCVMSALACAKSPSVHLTVEDIKQIYSQVCSDESITCAKLKGDGINGQYGIYASCRRAQRLSILMNEYYYKHSSNVSVCDFDGKASLISTKNMMDDLKTINDPNSFTKNKTCYLALGGEKNINPIYGIFKNEKETTIEEDTPSTARNISYKVLQSNAVAIRGTSIAALLLTICFVLFCF